MRMNKAASAILIGSAVVLAACASGKQSGYTSYDDCSDVAKGQRSFCMMEAHDAQTLQTARAQNKDVTIRSDNDSSNDTPAQAQAKQTYQATAAQCADSARGQRGYCMDQAYGAYMKAMGW